MSKTINFFKGHPTNSLLPAQKIVEATSQLLLNPRDFDNDVDNRHPLSYGSDPGAKWVRETVSDFVNESFSLDKYKSTSEDFNLTGGASYGVMNILAQTTLAHTNYTKQAFIITPTYFLINETFVDAGFGGKITAIDEYEDGTINLKLLEEKLKYYSELDQKDHSEDLKLIEMPKSSKKVYQFVLYCVPTFSNPGGQTYTLETRLKLLEIARKYDLLVITDDVYDSLDYTLPLDQRPKPELKRLTHLDRETYTNEFGNTVSNATFSKLIAPGLRFGYQETVNPKLVHQLSQGGANISGGTPAQLNSMIVGTIIKNGSIHEIIESLRKAFASRAKLLKENIEKLLPKGTKAYGFEGGYFVWVTLPAKYDSKKIVSKLKSEYNIVLAGGENFEVVGDLRSWGNSSVRLSISFLEEDDIVYGVKRWAEVINELYNE